METAICPITLDIGHVRGSNPDSSDLPVTPESICYEVVPLTRADFDDPLMQGEEGPKKGSQFSEPLGAEPT